MVLAFLAGAFVLLGAERQLRAALLALGALRVVEPAARRNAPPAAMSSTGFLDPSYPSRTPAYLFSPQSTSVNA